MQIAVSVRQEDRELWEWAQAEAKERETPFSRFLARALREYRQKIEREELREPGLSAAAG